MYSDRKEHYNSKGLYVGYDRNHKERDALDYYSTPTKEVENILDIMQLDLSSSILEPCAGGGHMLLGIENYLKKTTNSLISIKATDIQSRGNVSSFAIEAGPAFDFLNDDYPYTKDIDYIIMNPPYSVIEPFVMKSLGIANKGILMLGRLQFLEGQGRYENILKDFPPTTTYIYVDRISCFKNGNTNIKQASAQAYAWFWWDLKHPETKSEIKFIRRADKKAED